MAAYKLFIKASAVKDLEAVPKGDRERIIRRIKALAGNPRPVGHEKLSAGEKYRVRQGDYRVVYLVDNDALEITIFKIGHRREVYRR
ncbi:MAG TPA: type II toxin-antitoxin system RelE/ParE family toxin [bacterium]|nr:type II toxin-antitoxin system RelE/ParE family toxin [bacterium]